MEWSERCCEGFALAATIARDPGAVLAEAGLVASVRSDLLALPSELARMPKAERRQRIRRIAEAKPQLIPERVAGPSRALALLGGRIGGERGRAWLALAPLPRHGYVPPPQLVELLLRLVHEAPPSGGTDPWAE